MNRLDIIKRLVIDILYMDMADLFIDFFEHMYYKLELQDNKRIMEIRKKFERKSVDADDQKREDIIGIIVEEIFQNGNTELYTDLIDYHLKVFPDVKETFKRCGNNAEKWFCVYYDIDWNEYNECGDYLLYDLMFYDKSYCFMFSSSFLIERTFFSLYCLTYGNECAVNEFVYLWEYKIDSYHSCEREQHYEWRGIDIEDAVSSMEKIW